MRRQQIQLSGIAQIADNGTYVFNILDYVRNAKNATTGKEAMDEPYARLQRDIYNNIVLPSYRTTKMPDNPPSEAWARTAGATGALIYFPSGKYQWEGVPQLWPRTGIVGDGYFSTVFEYGNQKLFRTESELDPDDPNEPLPHWHLSSYGDPALLVVGDCTIMETELKGMNHGVRDIRFVPGQGGRDNNGIILAGVLMNQQLRDINLMQHGKGRSRVGLGSLAIRGSWTPPSINDIYADVSIKGGTRHSGHVNDLVVNNLQIERAEANVWLSGIVFGSITNCRYFHGKVGEIYTSCHDIRVANMATHCDLAGYYNKAMHVSTIIGQKCRVGYAYKAASRNDRDERLDLRFYGSGNADEKQMEAVGSQFDEDLGIWKAGDPVAGT